MRSVGRIRGRPQEMREDIVPEVLQLQFRDLVLTRQRECRGDADDWIVLKVKRSAMGRDDR